MLDSERDRLILINEKEELLKEMRFISPRKWTQGEVEQLEMARKRLEKDLQAARDTQSKALTERWGWAGAPGGMGPYPHYWSFLHGSRRGERDHLGHKGSTLRTLSVEILQLAKVGNWGK